MKDVYKGKIKVPFCVKNGIGETYPEIFCEILDFTPHLPYRHPHRYFGVDDDGDFDFWQDVEDFGENTTVYTLEELQAIIDEVNKGNSSPNTENVVEDGWIVRDGGECPVPPDTVVGVKLSNGKEITTKAFLLNWSHQNEDSDWYNIEKYKVITPAIDFGDVVSVEENDLEFNDTTTIKTNISFDITIKGKTFTLNSDELRDLYNQLCLVEGELQEWSLG